ncbi:MAG: hypothetical protein ABIT83_17515 [Massilia sp.]
MSIIAGPVNMAVSLEDARNSARRNGTDSDAEIEVQVRAFTGEAEHETGRSIIHRTHRVTLDRFNGAIRLPAPPVASVTVVKYFDVDGAEQELDPDDYLVDRESEPGYIVPAPGRAWPATQERINAVTVELICGYGPDHTTTPPEVKGFILAKVREYFAPAGTPESPHLGRLLDGLKVY